MEIKLDEKISFEDVVISVANLTRNEKGEVVGVEITFFCRCGCKGQETQVFEKPRKLKYLEEFYVICKSCGSKCRCVYFNGNDFPDIS